MNYLFSSILFTVSKWRGFEQYAEELKREFEEWLGEEISDTGDISDINILEVHL